MIIIIILDLFLNYIINNKDNINNRYSVNNKFKNFLLIKRFIIK